MKFQLAFFAVGLALGSPSLVMANGANVNLPNMNHTDGTLHVYAQIAANCVLQTAPLDFGSYDPLVAHNALALSATTTETATCTKGAQAQLTLVSQNSGAAYPNGSAAAFDTSGNASPATMSTNLVGAGNTPLRYTFTTGLNGGANAVPDSALYGGGYQQSIAFAGAGSSAPQSITFTGTIAPGQDVPTGSYTDTIVATLTF